MVHNWKNKSHQVFLLGGEGENRREMAKGSMVGGCGRNWERQKVASWKYMDTDSSSNSQFFRQQPASGHNPRTHPWYLLQEQISPPMLCCLFSGGPHMALALSFLCIMARLIVGDHMVLPFPSTTLTFKHCTHMSDINSATKAPSPFWNKST